MLDLPPCLPAPMDSRYVEYLEHTHGMPGCIVFSEGGGGLPRVWLRHPHSAMGVEVYLHGACITQWSRPNGAPLLYVNPDTEFSEDKPIKCGLDWTDVDGFKGVDVAVGVAAGAGAEVEVEACGCAPRWC